MLWSRNSADFTLCSHDTCVYVCTYVKGIETVPLTSLAEETYAKYMLFIIST